MRIYPPYVNKVKFTFNLLSNIECFYQNKCGAYIGWVSRGNLGDDALFLAHKKLFTTNKIHLYSKKFEKLSPKLYKFVILGGGTIIGGEGRHYLDQLLSLIKYNLPSFCIGTGAKEITDYKEEWHYALSRFKFVGVRGPLSKQYIEAIGIRNAVIVGDTLFSLSKNWYIKKEKSRKLGFNLTPVGLNEGLLTKIENFLHSLVKMGWEITFFNCCVRDKELIKNLANRISKKCKIILGEKLNISNYLRVIEKCDIFIGERLHSVVSAIITRTPSIMIEYHPKCYEFMLSIGYEDFSFNIENIKNVNLLDKLEELYDNLHFHQERINKKVNYFSELQKNIAKNLINELRK